MALHVSMCLRSKTFYGEFFLIIYEIQEKYDFSKVESASHFVFHLGRGMLGRKSPPCMALHVSMCMSSKTIYGDFF